MRNFVQRLVFIFACMMIMEHMAVAQMSIAAAGDLQFFMSNVAQRFQAETGKQVRVTYGSSGNFFQQLENGAPFDLFFSANLDYARKLLDEGFAEPGSLYEYAQGKLVIWVPNSSWLDLRRGLQLLADPSVRKIAIANPQHAPYGQAAVAAMKSRGLYQNVQSKLILGENVSQTFSFVAAGAAEVGLVALALTVSPNVKEKGRFAEVPSDSYPQIRQACVILKSSQNKETARQFLAFIKTPAIAHLLREYGFDVPGDK